MQPKLHEENAASSAGNCAQGINAAQSSERRSESGFSMLELVIVVAILVILGAITAPKLLTMIETERLQNTTRAYASFLQQCRYRAEQDGQWYEILLDTTNPSVTIAYLDINGDNVRQSTEPAVEIPAPITIPNPTSASIPTGFQSTTLMGATPLTADTTPATWNCRHDQDCSSTSAVQTAGLQFNERGLPCQRTSNTVACTNTTTINITGGGTATAPVAWITYFAYPPSSGGTNYSAVTVTPAGRIKVWNYQSASGGGSWQ